MGDKLSVWPWLVRVAVDWAVIIACFMVLNKFWNPVAFVLCVLVIGTRQHAVGILGHDGGHRLICHNKVLNDFLTNLFCFWPLVISIEGYRRFHFQHHRNVNTEADPELIHKRLMPQWEGSFNCWHLIGDMLGGGLIHVILAGYLMRCSKIRYSLPLLLYLISLGYVFWYLELLWIPCVWFWCLISSFWLVFRLRVWTEHVNAGSGDTHRLARPPLWARLLFLPHNTWCHWEHHERPNIPFWKLPRLNHAYVLEQTDVSTLFSTKA